MTADTDQPTLAVLKPCPFCGGERARTIHIRDGRKVACVCGACGKPEFHGPLDRPDAEARAITAWNTRTTHEPRPAGDLREALEGLVEAYCNSESGEVDRRLAMRSAIDALATHSPAPMAGEGKQIADNLTPNQRLIVQERDYEIGNRRARTLARNYVRALRLIWSDGLGLTPLGEQVRAYLDAHPSTQEGDR